MKKPILLVAAVGSLLLSACSGCSNDEKIKVGSKEDIVKTYVQLPQMATNEADTAEVIKQVHDFIDCLKNKNVDGALKMVHFLNRDKITEVPESLAKRQRQVLQIVSGCPKYEVENLFFYKEKDSEVRIKVTLFEKEENDPAPNVMKIRLQPIRRDGQWYLTLFDSEHDTNHGSEIHN